MTPPVHRRGTSQIRGRRGECSSDSGVYLKCVDYLYEKGRVPGSSVDVSGKTERSIVRLKGVWPWTIEIPGRMVSGPEGRESVCYNSWGPVTESFARDLSVMGIYDVTGGLGERRDLGRGGKGVTEQ